MASGNGISGLLNFKIFTASGFDPRTQISSYGHGMVPIEMSILAKIPETVAV